MLPRNDLDRIHIAFDDHCLIASAGLILLVTLAQHLGQGEPRGQAVDPGGLPHCFASHREISPLEMVRILSLGHAVEIFNTLRVQFQADFKTNPVQAFVVRHCCLRSTAALHATRNVYMRPKRKGDRPNIARS